MSTVEDQLVKLQVTTKVDTNESCKDTVKSEMKLPLDKELAENTVSDYTKEESNMDDDRSLNTSVMSEPLSEASSPSVDDALTHSYTTMLTKLLDYYNSEVDVCSEDFKLLQDMNEVEKVKFEEMLTTCQKSGDVLFGLNGSLSSVQPCLHKLDQIEKDLDLVEKRVEDLDKLSRQLETAFQKAEKY